MSPSQKGPTDNRRIAAKLRLPSDGPVEEHQPVGDQITRCSCGDWHPAQFFIEAAHPATEGLPGKHYHDEAGVPVACYGVHPATEGLPGKHYHDEAGVPVACYGVHPATEGLPGKHYHDEAGVPVACYGVHPATEGLDVERYPLCTYGRMGEWCDKPFSDLVHVRPDERMQPGKHVWRFDPKRARLSSPEGQK